MNNKLPPEQSQKFEKQSYGDTLLAILLGCLVLIMFIQVFCRYVLNSSLSWSEELAKYLFVWMTFIGGALCFRDKMHIGVDYFASLLPKYLCNGLQLFNLLLINIFCIVVAVSGLIWVFMVHGTYTPALGWPLNIVFYGAVPVGYAMTVFYGFRRLISELKNKDSK
jgi:TRAP-type transport system small permease protein